MKNRDAHAFIKKRKRNRSIPDAQRAWLDPPRKPYRVPQKGAIRLAALCRSRPERAPIKKAGNKKKIRMPPFSFPSRKELQIGSPIAGLKQAIWKAGLKAPTVCPD